MTRIAVPPQRIDPPPTPTPAILTSAARALGATAEGAAGGLALGGVVAGAAGIALAAAERPSFLAPPTLHGGDPAWLAGPLAGLWPALTSSLDSLRWDITLALLAMTACWLLAVATARRVGLVAVLVAATASIVLLTLSPPFSLTDTFNYLHYGRMQPLHGLNPYTALPIQAANDPTYVFTTWHHLTSPYGPLFTLYTEALARLPLATAYWVLRATVGLAALAVVALTGLLARRLGREPAPAVAFVALNPLVLVYGVGGAHNDVLFMLALLGGLLLTLRRRELLGGGAWAMAAAIKLSGALVVPVLLAGSTRRWRALIGLAIGGVVLLAMIGVGFGGHIPNDATQSKLVASLSLPNLLGIALGHGGDDATIRGELEVALVLCTAGLALWTWHTRDWPVAAAWAMALLVVALGWAMPWYVLWLLPFAALSRQGSPRAIAIVLTLYLLAIWVPATPPLLHHLGVFPGATPTGRANARFMHALLK